MNKKLIIGLLAILVIGYGVYATFFLERVAIGDLCKGSAMCDGECLGFGDLLPDYTHQQICTVKCSSDGDCPKPTSCLSTSVVTLGETGSSEERYCLPSKESTQRQE